MLGVLGDAAGAVARWSQVTRTSGGGDGEEVRLLAGNAAREIGRLAAWVVIDLALPLDRKAVLAEADLYLGEVEAEDDGLMHAADAIAALLEVRLAAVAGERAVSECDFGRHAVKILAPLVAQAACLSWSDGGA